MAKRLRQARAHGLTSLIKIKRPGNKHYRGMGDPNKGKKKKTWFELACWACDYKYKTEPGSLPACPQCNFKLEIPGDERS
jgi:hypothetical protein